MINDLLYLLDYVYQGKEMNEQPSSSKVEEKKEERFVDKVKKFFTNLFK